MEIRRLSSDQAERLRSIRLRALKDAPDAFGSTLEETQRRPLSSWSEQLAELATFLAVVDRADVGYAAANAPRQAGPQEGDDR